MRFFPTEKVAFDGYFSFFSFACKIKIGLSSFCHFGQADLKNHLALFGSIIHKIGFTGPLWKLTFLAQAFILVRDAAYFENRPLFAKIGFFGGCCRFLRNLWALAIIGKRRNIVWKSNLLNFISDKPQGDCRSIFWGTTKILEGPELVNATNGNDSRWELFGLKVEAIRILDCFHGGSICEGVLIARVWGCKMTLRQLKLNGFVGVGLPGVEEVAMGSIFHEFYFEYINTISLLPPLLPLQSTNTFIPTHYFLNNLYLSMPQLFFFLVSWSYRTIWV